MQTPPNITKEAIEKYGNDFYGYGSWKADYWLIGVEERGCEDKRPNEFIDRYNAWFNFVSPELVDLRQFSGKANIQLDWGNSTWKALHRLLRDAGVDVDELTENNRLWGGSQDVQRGSRHVALIEAMPFPAVSTKKWPYANWEWDFMKTRFKCRNNFLAERIKFIYKKALEMKPKAIIDYGNVWNKINNLTDPTLYRTTKINDSIWISPVKIAGAYPFDTVARIQTSSYLKNNLGNG